MIDRTAFSIVLGATYATTYSLSDSDHVKKAGKAGKAERVYRSLKSPLLAKRNWTLGLYVTTGARPEGQAPTTTDEVNERGIESEIYKRKSNRMKME